MAASNEVIVVLIDTSQVPPVLIARTKEYDPINGSISVETQLDSGLQCVAVYNKRDLDGDMGGPFTDEYSGNSQYRVKSTGDGIDIAKRDLTGGTQGVRTRGYFNNATPSASEVEIAKAFEDSVMGQGAGWIVYEDGQGALYEAELEKARALVGFPT